MVKDNILSFEDYVAHQSPSMKRAMGTGSSYKQNHLIRQHLTDWLLNKFPWDFWVTFTFGFDPDLDEVLDLLHDLHHRVDTRLLKHSDLPMMNVKDRSKWILFPEYKGRGLHYHGFLQLNTRPNLGNAYRSEWHWMDAALRNILEGWEHRLSNGGPITHEHYDRGWRTRDMLKMILYSMKEYGKGSSHFDQNPSQDRFAYTVVSWTDWKISPIKRRSRNRKNETPVRPDKVFEHSLETFFN